jgi:hypothetical protein
MPTPRFELLHWYWLHLEQFGNDRIELRFFYD